MYTQLGYISLQKDISARLTECLLLISRLQQRQSSLDMLSILDRMPAEVLILIFGSLSREDFLCLQLTSKNLRTAVTTLAADFRHPPRVSWLPPSHEVRRFLETHLKIENETAKRHLLLSYLICTCCGKIKRRHDWAGFSDDQSQTGVLYRYCMSCCVGNGFIDGKELSPLTEQDCLAD